MSSRHFLRFDLFNRILHGTLMGSFLGLAATGLPLKFNWAPWASDVAHAMGGFTAILFFHKSFAVILTLVFLFHIGRIVRAAMAKRGAEVFWGPESMVPQPKDLFDLLGHFRWFLGLGPKPRFDRFTYWEKFDYWAVFWGMAIIGTSGYMLWFSSFFAKFVSGWTFNLALVVHSEEALLAVWFIFAIHFFNSHLRPEKFPMDLVIFTGRVSEDELRHERPDQYDRLVGEDGLVPLETDAPPRWLLNYGRVLGTTVIAIGFVLFGLTLLAF